MAIAESMAAAAAHLREHPDEARYTDSRATARVERGLRVVVADPAGREVATDMVRGVGGDDSAPSPGWLFRASLASCVATFVVIRAAVLGVEPGSFEVSVESESDDRGALDLDPSVPAGPLSVSMVVAVDNGGSAVEDFEAVVRWAVAHCPVSELLRRDVPVDVVVR
jgi:uncharacterized OsmC-like protein